MIIKRIRRSAKRQRRSLEEVGTIVDVLSSYVLNASADRELASDGENALARYVLDTHILDGHVTEPGEKVDLHGTRCLHGSELMHHQRQMLAANLLAPRVMDPIEHYMLSWQSGELPVPAQVEEAVDIFAQEIGYENCQIVWATHSNTANYHLHLVVNRIDLARQKVVTPGDGWEIDRLHQVTALIEDAQGWASEPNAIYTARGGEVRERSTGKIMRRANGSRQGCDTRKKTSPEKWRSPEFAAVADALRSAQTWQDLHNRLNKLDATYREKGSGAEITIGETRMKATSLGREFSYNRMTKKLGEFTPDPLRERDPFEDYQAALRAERERVREALNQALAELRKRRLLLKKQTRAEERAHKALIAEARLELCFDRAEAEVKTAFDRARLTIAESALRRDAWYKANRPPPIEVELPELIFAPNLSRAKAIARAHGLIGRESDYGVEYSSGDGTRAITDAGVVLIVHRIDREAIAAGLAMASMRGDHIVVDGSGDFLEVCRDVASEKGYTLACRSGEILHDPTAKAQKVASPKAPNETTSPSATTPQQATRNTSDPRKSATKSVAARASHRSRQSAGLGHDTEEEVLSDEVRWAAMQGKGRGSGL